MNREYLKVEEISFSYEDKERVLSEVSLSVKRGEKVGIIGPNGAGKTTLFMAICGVYPPSEGEIYIQDEKVQPQSFNPKVGYVFQNSNDQLFSPTVYDDVAFGPINLGLEEKDVKKRVERALELCGVSHVANRSSHHLSGGEKRMVAIASVLSLEPTLVIYDEPTSNLDMRSRRRIINLIDNSEQTTLIASHDLELIVELCPRVILIDGGKIAAQGATKEIMSDKDLMEKSGLEVPYSLR